VTLIAPAAEEFRRKVFPITTAAKTALQEKGIEVISLQEPFTQYTTEPMHLLASHRHWTAEGTRVAAAVVRERVRAVLGLPTTAVAAGR
jgi:hypothetical protein